MFGIFKKQSKSEKLNRQYKKLLNDAYILSKTNRRASDAKMVEANQLLAQLETIKTI